MRVITARHTRARLGELYRARGETPYSFVHLKSKGLLFIVCGGKFGLRLELNMCIYTKKGQFEQVSSSRTNWQHLYRQVRFSLTSPTQMLYELIKHKLTFIVSHHCSVTVEYGVHMLHFFLAN